VLEMQGQMAYDGLDPTGLTSWKEVLGLATGRRRLIVGFIVLLASPYCAGVRKLPLSTFKTMQNDAPVAGALGGSILAMQRFLRTRTLCVRRIATLLRPPQLPSRGKGRAFAGTCTPQGWRSLRQRTACPG